MDRRARGRPESQGSLPPISARRSGYPPASPHPHVNGGGGGGGGGGGSPFATPGTEAWRYQQQPQYQASALGLTTEFEKGLQA